MTTIDLRPMIVPKSDQLNADDLIGQSLTIRITRVTDSTDPDQPLSIHYEGGDGRPYKPCKSMRRVLAHIWGMEANKFVGRRMTLYRDDRVRFGNEAVGGIRISHLSDIQREQSIALMVTRGKRLPYVVKPLPPEGDAPRQQQRTGVGQQTGTSELSLAERATNYETRLKGAPNSTKLRAIREAGAALRDALDVEDPERLVELEQLFNDRFDMLVEQEQEDAA
jgi:hypothetical protein